MSLCTCGYGPITGCLVCDERPESEGVTLASIGIAGEKHAVGRIQRLEREVRASRDYVEGLKAAATRFLDEYSREFYSGTDGPWTEPPDGCDVAYQALRAALVAQGKEHEVPNLGVAGSSPAERANPVTEIVTTPFNPGGRPCAACGAPVWLPTTRYQPAVFIFNDRVWHGYCAPKSGESLGVGD